MPDPDGYFHAFMASHTWLSGYVTEFPYLPETIVHTYWTDQHWLYHLIVAPLTAVMNPLIAVKVSAVVLGLLYVMLFYFLLAKLLKNSRSAFWWTLLLLISGPFILRLVLVKAQPLALMALLFGLYAYQKRRYGTLFVIQLLYTLAHGSFLLLPALIGWSLVYDALFNRQVLSISHLAKVVAGIVPAIVIGVFSQPTFPENIMFYWYQTVEIGLIGVHELTLTGTEWEGTSLIGFFSQLGLLTALSVVMLIVAIGRRKRVTNNTLYWLWLCIPLAVLSASSIRNFEFFIPILIIAYALTWNEWRFSSISYRTNFILRSPVAGGFVMYVIALYSLYIVINPLVTLYTWQTVAIPYDFLREEGIFIENMISDNSIVLNTRWDIFPMLLYHSDGAQFLTGMDPAFYFFENPEGYRALVHARDTGEVDRLLDNLQYNYDNIYIAMHSSDADNKTIPVSETHVLTKMFDGKLVSIYKVSTPY